MNNTFPTLRFAFNKAFAAPGKNFWLSGLKPAAGQSAASDVFSDAERADRKLAARLHGFRADDEAPLAGVPASETAKGKKILAAYGRDAETFGASIAQALRERDGQLAALLVAIVNSGRLDAASRLVFAKELESRLLVPDVADFPDGKPALHAVFTLLERLAARQ